MVSLITKAYFHIFGEIFADNILEIAPVSPADCSLKNSAGGQNGNILCPVMVLNQDSWETRDDTGLRRTKPNFVRIEV